jgi:hypothetical protein
MQVPSTCGPRKATRWRCIRRARCCGLIGLHQMQAQILMFAPKIMQVTARQGSADFSYGKGPAFCRRGRRIASIWRPKTTPGACPSRERAQKAGMSTGAKVAYFILAGAGTGLAAWGIHDLIQSNNGVKSPAKPSNLKASSGRSVRIARRENVPRNIPVQGGLLYAGLGGIGPSTDGLRLSEESFP